MPHDDRSAPASLEHLAERLRDGRAVVAGCLSGTSADGIDVVLARFAPSGGELGAPATLAFETVPFEPDLRARVRGLLDGVGEARPLSSALADAAFLSRDLGLAFGGAVRDVAQRAGERVDLVGSHGQTVWHHDGGDDRGRATLQLGEPACVSAACDAPVVADFRQADLAAGGEGAPISALVDRALFPAADGPLAILNLGGMANVTVLPARGARRGASLAFDTGPAGSLLDGLARAHLSASFDDGGRAALRGTADQALFTPFLAHPFFDRSPPKSTGRDTFGEAWVAEWSARAASSPRTSADDLLASGVAFVACTVADALERFAPEVREVVACGGGVRNAALLAALARRTGRGVRSSAELGVDPDAREALAFAVLAARCVLGVPSTEPWATGAARGAVLGALTPGASRSAR